MTDIPGDGASPRDLKPVLKDHVTSFLINYIFITFTISASLKLC
jgi:hypothetical protein